MKLSVKYDFMFDAQARSLTNPDNLAVNRQGGVSPAQISAFQHRRNRYGPQIVIVFAVTVLVLLFLAFEIPQSSPQGNDVVPAVMFFIVMAVLLCFLFVPAFTEIMWASRLKRELAEGRVEAADGQVEWKRGEYIAETNGRRLRPIFEETLNLLPGAYRFYHLPGTGGLLSAEASGYGGRSMSSSEMITSLAQAHHFDPSSLEANRGGRQASEQSLRLTLIAGMYLLGALLSIAIGIGVVILYKRSGAPAESIISVLFMTLSLVIFGLYIFWRGVLIASDAWMGSVESAQGYVHKSVWHGRSTSYHYYLGGLHWRVSRQAFNALVEGISYRIYYVPHSRRLIAIEPVEA